MSRLTAVGAVLLALGLAAIPGPMAAGPPHTSPQQWISLFNGHDLDGWTPKITGYAPGVNFGNTFRVEDGRIKVVYDEYGEFNGRFGHLFYKDTFSYYRLRVEYRFVGEQAPGGAGWALRNSGVMLHGERPDDMTLDQEFPTSIEVQFLGGNGTDERTTSNLCTPGTNVVMDGQLILRHCTNARSKTYHGDQWVTAEVEVCGSRSIRHVLEGEVVIAYSEPQLDERDAHARTLAERAGTLLLEAGTISLQSESHPVEFRRVDLLPLTADSCGGHQ
jgi:hypothetical protein